MTSRTDAEQRARRLYAGPGYRRAYVKGAQAALDGHHKSANPYRYVPGSAGYHHAWQSGYLSIPASEGDFE